MSIERLFRGRKLQWKAGLCFLVTVALAAMALVPVASPARAATDLVQNGSFEEPAVIDPADWDIFDSPINGWAAEWMPNVGSYQGEEPPIPAKIELHAGVNGWTACDEYQYVEMDTDWGGPGDPLNGEPASIHLYQDVIGLTAGSWYTLSFYTAARPDCDAQDCVIDVEWGGDFVDSIEKDGTGVSMPQWGEPHTYPVLATDSTMRLSFKDMGTPNSLGMFLDNVQLEAMPVPKLTLVKAGEYAPDTGIIHYHIGWEVTGEEGTLYDVTITDTIPEGTTYVEDSASLPGLEDSGTITWNLGSKSTGDNGTVSFDVYLDAAFASSVEAYEQGLKNNGNPVDANRSNPDATLGAPETNGDDSDNPWEPEWFFSLGFAGDEDIPEASITLEFDTPILNGVDEDIFVYEVTGGNYPDEQAEVYAGNDLNDLRSLGTVTRDGRVDLEVGGLSYATYVKIVDISDPESFDGNADGYDVDAVLALHPGVCGINNEAEIFGWIMEEHPQQDPNATAEASTPTIVNPDACVPTLEIIKTGIYDEGNNEVDYTITWDVVGVGTLYGVEITDEIPAGTTYVTDSATGDSIFDLGVYDSVEEEITWGPEDVTGPASDILYFSVTLDSLDPWADSVEGFTQGQRKDNSDVLEERSHPEKALHEAENTDTLNFVSLGFGEIDPTNGNQLGELILGFTNFIMNDPYSKDISVVETSYGDPSDEDYPETVEVYASNNLVNWTLLSSDGGGIQDEEFELGFLPWAKYLKLVDCSDKNEFPDSADGYDVDGVEALHPAPAECSIENTVVITGHSWNNWWEDFFGEEILAEDTESTVLNPIACDAHVYGMKFNDKDGDGVKDTGDNGLEGWTIYAGSLLQILYVDSYGPETGTPIDSFPLVDGQKYFVGVAGTFEAGDSITADAKYSIRSGPNWTDEVEGYEGYGAELLDLQIDGETPDWGAYNEGHLYWDTVIGDGGPITFQIYDIYASNNVGMLPVVIYEVIDEDITDEDGNYELTIPGGQYPYVQIIEEWQDGWQQTYPTLLEQYHHNINLTTPVRDFYDIDFGNYNPNDNSIAGTKFYDLDGDGTWDDGELPLEGWKIYIDENSDGEWDAEEPYVITDEDGEYIFQYLADSEYIIREVLEDNWTQTLPDATKDCEYVVNVEGGEEVSERDFGNILYGSISGYKFEDLNENGEWGEEPTIEGWTIFLDMNENEIWDEGEPFTYTDSSGYYTFPGLEEGTYFVWEVVQDGWSQTCPIIPHGDYYYELPINETKSDWSDINFGNFDGEVTIQGNPGGGGGYTPPTDGGDGEEVLGEQDEGDGSGVPPEGGEEAVGGEQDTLPVTGLDIMWLTIFLLSLSGLLFMPVVVRRV